VAAIVLILLLGLELKHYAADYLLQPRWLLGGKGNLAAIGGYAHAGIHALGTAIVLFIVGTPLLALLLICAAEFVVHYGIDFVKYRYLSGVDVQTAPWRFWALHGLDQMLHQITYAVIVFFVMLSVASHVAGGV
jgi:hypothetical protein